MKNLLFLAILLCTLFLAVPFAGAYTMWDIDKGDKLTLQDNYNSDYDGEVVGAGMFTFTAENSNGSVVDFTSWCAEYDVYINSDTQYEILSLDKVMNQSAWLLTKYFKGDWDDELLNDTEAQAQFQRALWSFDSDFDSPYYDDSGSVTDYISLANTAVQGGWTNNEYIAIANLGEKVQNQYIPLNSAHTPEPATMVLFGIGLLGIGGVLRKRGKKNRA